MEIAVLRSRGVDFVGGMHAQSKVDFRRGQWIGLEEHRVQRIKPPRPDWMSREDYAAFPATMCMRELRDRVERDGYRSRTIVIATTLLDSAA